MNIKALVKQGQYIICRTIQERKWAISLSPLIRCLDKVGRIHADSNHSDSNHSDSN